MCENYNKQRKINCKEIVSKRDSDYFFTEVYSPGAPFTNVDKR